MCHRASPLLVLLLTTLCLSGCGNGDNKSTLDLGSVSIGAQLIDLKKARDAGAISGKEYRTLKANMLALVNDAATLNDNREPSDDAQSSDSDGDGDGDDDNPHEQHEDDDSGFLF